ncbi:MAG: TrkH family potassium uptake protein, partial [Lachnospiraceae bacterium]|nr:TrkH family potassium uptake protein [Lachnospiraceae bacterium]
MNRKMIAYVVGKILMAEAVLMMLPVITGIVFREKETWAFVITALLCLLCSLLLGFKRPENMNIRAGEGFAIVSLGWVFLSLFGCLPFIFTGEIPSFIDAFFETVSGFTTTGASILPDVTYLSRASLFWRSFTHWIGGMGVLVFIMA